MMADLRALMGGHRRVSLYWSNRDAICASNAERRLAKKLDHTCSDCPKRSLVDNVRCEGCRDRNRATSARRRERLAVAP
jgi:hypothetical protein